MMLNELNDTLTSTLPPTDSRLRPDVRQMEKGDIGQSVHRPKLPAYCKVLAVMPTFLQLCEVLNVLHDC